MLRPGGRRVLALVSGALGVALVTAAAAVGLVLASPGAGTGAGTRLWVDGASRSCSDGRSRQEATSAATPWCSVARAAGAVVAGDTVQVLPGTYAGTVRVASSGRPAAPIRFVAPRGGVTLDARGAPAAVVLASVTDVALEGFAVRGARVQGVVVAEAQRIALGGLVVSGNGGPGVQIRQSATVAVTRSRIERNGGTGIFESTGSRGGRYVENEILGNGIDGQPYNGDGLQIGGTGAHVTGNTVRGNGDPGPFEHGIYTAATARHVLIEANVVADNAGSNVKAAGAGGVVRANRLEGGRLGLVLSDNETPAAVHDNLIVGPHRHGVFLTTDRGPARARLWNNTVEVTAPSSWSGDGSGIFVTSAALLDLRGNVVSYAGREGAAGSALHVPDDAQVQGSPRTATGSRPSSPAGGTWSGTATA